LGGVTDHGRSSVLSALRALTRSKGGVLLRLVACAGCLLGVILQTRNNNFKLHA